MRVDLYTTIHKAQRFHLFRLADAIGLADFADATTCEGLGTVVRQLLAHLRDHARSEATYIHPLFRALGPAADHFDEAHHTLDALIAEVEATVDAGRWDELYPCYTRFLGRYLLHLDEEEEAQRQILWSHYGDDALGAVFQRFKAERPPAKAMDDLVFMLPALSVPELTRLFQGMKAAAPAPAFQHAWDMAARTLEATRWQQVQDAVLTG